MNLKTARYKKSNCETMTIISVSQNPFEINIQEPEGAISVNSSDKIDVLTFKYGLLLSSFGGEVRDSALNYI